MNRLFLGLWILFSMTSCTNFGPHRLPSNRLSYNYSLQYSDSQQQLLNIVRLRYSDSPYFLSVNNIVSQLNVTNELQLQVGNDPRNLPLRAVTNGVGRTQISETPTITYMPLQGEAYVTRLLTPIDISVIYMLLRSGWGINHVFKILVQRMGSIENAVLASRITSSRIPRFKEFEALFFIMRKLQYQELVQIESTTIQKKFAIKLTITSFTGLNAKERVLLARVGLTPHAPSVWLVGHPTQEKNQLYVQTRTMMGVFNYLSKSVDVPQEDILCHKAPMTYMANGQIFDWRVVTAGLISVKTSKNPPKDALVCIQYRGSWFYISDSDSESKETLNLLTVIMGIYEGNPKIDAPVFTIS